MPASATPSGTGGGGGRPAARGRHPTRPAGRRGGRRSGAAGHGRAPGLHRREMPGSGPRGQRSRRPSAVSTQARRLERPRPWPPALPAPGPAGLAPAWAVRTTVAFCPQGRRAVTSRRWALPGSRPWNSTLDALVRACSCGPSGEPRGLSGVRRTRPDQPGPGAVQSSDRLPGSPWPLTFTVRGGPGGWGSMSESQHPFCPRPGPRAVWSGEAACALSCPPRTPTSTGSVWVPCPAVLLWREGRRGGWAEASEGHPRERGRPLTDKGASGTPQAARPAGEVGSGGWFAPRRPAGRRAGTLESGHHAPRGPRAHLTWARKPRSQSRAAHRTGGLIPAAPAKDCQEAAGVSRTPEAGGQGRGTCHQERGAASEPQTLPPTPAALVCEGRAEGTGQGPDGRAPLPCLPTPPPALSLGEAGGGASRASGRSWQLAGRWPCRPPPAPHPQPGRVCPPGGTRGCQGAPPLCAAWSAS